MIQVNDMCKKSLGHSPRAESCIMEPVSRKQSLLTSTVGVCEQQSPRVLTEGGCESEWCGDVLSTIGHERLSNGSFYPHT